MEPCRVLVRSSSLFSQIARLQRENRTSLRKPLPTTSTGTSWVIRGSFHRLSNSFSSVLIAQGAMRPYSSLIPAAVVAWWGRGDGLIRNRRQSLCVFVPHGRPPSVTLHGIRLIGSAADTWHNPSPHRESSGRGAPESGCCPPTFARES